MKRTYEIRDEWDGRVYFRTHRHPLRFVRKHARDIATREHCNVVIVNTATNRLLDIIRERIAP